MFVVSFLIRNDLLRCTFQCKFPKNRLNYRVFFQSGNVFLLTYLYLFFSLISASCTIAWCQLALRSPGKQRITNFPVRFRQTYVIEGLAIMPDCFVSMTQQVAMCASATSIIIAI